MPDSETLSPREPIRVALVITGLEVGGAEKCLTQLALGLDRARFSPQVYSLQPRPVGERAALVERLEAAGLPLHFLNASGAWSFLPVVWTLRRLLKRQNPQLVQTFLYHANVVGTIAAKAAGVPRTATGLRVADRNVRRMRLERLASRWAHAQVAVSDRVAAFYREMGFASDRITVIPNAVDAAAYENVEPADLTQEGIPATRRVVLYVGRLDEQQKAIGQFLISCGPLLDVAADVDIVLAGDGPDRALIERSARSVVGASANREGRIHLLGWRPDVPQLLKRASVVVLPSRYEGMPNVVLEAMAAGVPVVASRVEGMEEIFCDRLAEYTVGFAQAADWQERILKLLNSRASREEFVAWSQMRIRERFTIQVMTAAYERLWL